MPSRPARSDLKARLSAAAREAGFVSVGVVAATDVPELRTRLDSFLALGRHGDMHWLAREPQKRAAPLVLWPQARSIVMLASRYDPDGDPLDVLARKDRAAISCYARGGDYHDRLKTGLTHVATWLAAESGAETRVFVDTAPLMEKPLAAAAGLGWQGKHTNLVSRDAGSWTFLGAILASIEIEPDTPEEDHCGSCRRCLDVCPTAAFPAPYQLDARRCIAYLTIEHKGHIARDLRPLIGNRVFGCDDCLAVCPWNKFARKSNATRLGAGEPPALAEVLDLDEAAFRRRYSGTVLKRTGRARVVRNALIAAGNSGEASLLARVERLLGDASPLVRAAAVWAAGRLAGVDHVALLGDRHLPLETDAFVRAEWHAILVESAPR
jgi:epoxyqueuosine reductase